MTEMELKYLLGKLIKVMNRDNLELSVLVGIFMLSVLSLSPISWAGPTDDNHVHVEQVSGGDNASLNINQIGWGNSIEFSFNHQNNTFNFLQSGNGNTISWVPYWGSGKSWGGDVDGTGNVENVSQYNGATYGRHIWGNNNLVDIYQSGGHTHYIDVHADNVDHDAWQEGTGTHYSHVYYYGQSDDSTTNLKQEGTGNHTANIIIRGNEHTTLNLHQLGSSNQTYNLTQNCYTVGGCSVSVTQQ